MHTGELTAKPLNREEHTRYLLQITAQDRGSPITYQGTCNISIAVEDQNDSNPRFELSKYTVTVAEVFNCNLYPCLMYEKKKSCESIVLPVMV